MKDISALRFRYARTLIALLGTPDRIVHRIHQHLLESQSIAVSIVRDTERPRRHEGAPGPRPAVVG